LELRENVIAGVRSQEAEGRRQKAGGRRQKAGVKPFLCLVLKIV